MRLRRYVIVAERPADDGAGLRHCRRRHRGGVRAHVGDEPGALVAEVDALVEALGERHGLADAEPETVDFDLARRLLALPHIVGPHPDTGEPIRAGIGRYGPWLRHEDIYAAIPADVTDKEIRESRARGPKQVLRRLGRHPDDGSPVWLKTGHHGPFVAHRRRYAGVPQDLALDTLTLEQAVDLLSARRSAGRSPRSP